MSNFFNTHDFIVSILMILSLIPVYFIWRSVIALLYKLSSRFGWNFRLFSTEEEALRAYKPLYYARLLPNPYWDDTRKEKWAASWWICGLAGIAIFFLHIGLSMMI